MHGCLGLQGQAPVSVFEHMKVLEEMWQYLRAGILFYLRRFGEGSADAAYNAAGIDVPPPADLWAEYTEACKKAQQDLLAYAKLAEQHFGHHLCTYTLHSLICKLPRQQLQVGHADFFKELYVERIMQAAKRTSKFRTTGAPELVIVAEMLWGQALGLYKALNPELKTFDELVPDWGGDPNLKKGHWLDEVPAGESLLGSGERVLQEQELQDMQDLFDKYVDVFEVPDEQLQVLGAGPYLVVRYKRAHRDGVEFVHSEAYERARTRESFYVSVHYHEVHGPCAVRRKDP